MGNRGQTQSETRDPSEFTDIFEEFTTAARQYQIRVGKCARLLKPAPQNLQAILQNLPVRKKFRPIPAFFVIFLIDDYFT